MRADARIITATDAEVSWASRRYLDLTFLFSSTGMRELVGLSDTHEVVQVETEAGTFVGVVVASHPGRPTRIRLMLVE